MKKDGFNPRININNSKNLFKMSPEELENETKIMEQELKKIKKGNQSTNVSNITSLNTSNATKNKFNKNIKKLDNKNIKEHSPRISESIKQNLINMKVDSGSSDNALYLSKNNFNSFFSSNKEYELQSVANNLRRSNSNKNKNRIMIGGFKNKLNMSLNDSNIEIRTKSTNKNLIPINQEQEKHIHNALSKLKCCQKIALPDEKNYFISEKNLKMIESAIQDKDSDIQNLKVLLKLAKSDMDSFQSKYRELYGIIEEQNNEKNSIIENFEFYISENKQLKENYDDICFQYNKILIIFKKVEIFINIVFKLINSYDDMLKKENLENDNSTKNENLKNFIQKENNPKFTNLLNNLKELIQEKELRTFNYLYLELNEKIDTNNLNKINNSNFLLSSNDKNYIKMEKMNKELKSKLYDYESFIKKVSEIEENKIINLADIAKDMLYIKKRNMELNNLNENLEKENEYLRISYHNLYNDFVNIKNELSENLEIMKNHKNDIKILKQNEDYLKKQREEFLKRITELEINTKELNEKLNNLLSDNNKLNAERTHYKTEFDKAMENNVLRLEADQKLYEVTIINGKLNSAVQEKENIINELKMRIKDKEALKSNIKNDRKDSNISDYLNKSDDNILYTEKAGNNDNQTLQKKIISLEMQNKMYKNKFHKNETNNLPDMNNDKFKINSFINDLMFHIYNQSKAMEKLIDI